MEPARRAFLKKSAKIGGGLVLLVGGGTIVGSLFGCASRPQVKGGEYYSINSDIRLGGFNQDVARYQARPVGIFGVPYYHVATPIGEALFKKGFSVKDTELHFKNGKITGSTRRRPGEEGLYFLDPALNEKGKKIDYVAIDPRYKKMIRKEHELIDERDGLAIFREVEKDYPFDFGVIFLSEEKPYLAIKENEPKEGFYDFYLTPVEGAVIRTFEEDGRIKICNNNRIIRPHLLSWKDIEKKISKLKKEKQEKAKKDLEEFWIPIAIEAKDTDNE